MTFGASGVPTSHQLSAALKVLRILPTDETSIASVRRGYRLLASDGVFGTDDYRVGEEILVVAEYVRRTHSSICRDPAAETWVAGIEARRQLLAEFMIRTQPAWIAAATRGYAVRPELIPTEANEALATTMENAQTREAFLLSIGQKYEQNVLQEFGLEGELAAITAWSEALAAHGRRDLVDEISHVSLRSDTLGYDVVAPDLTGEDVRLEIKTVGSTRNHLTIYLSRNEFETGMRDRRWRLIIFRRNAEGTFDVHGWLSAPDIATHLPQDRSEIAAWTATRIDLSADDLRPGLPINAVEFE